MSSPDRPLVRLDRVHKTFNQGTVSQMGVFQDFSFQIQEGEFISVVGSNGSGKTTLLNLICGSFPVDSGRIFLRERDITRMPEHRRARSIGRVFQDPAKGTCPALTILENLSLADHKGGGYGLCPRVSQRRRGHHRPPLQLLPPGPEDKIHLPVGVLSGGQRQALALLISTMVPINLLVLDEPTAALDPNSAENVMELTDRIVREKGVTAIMVTHNLRFAADYGTRLVMMDRGRCVIDSGGEGKAGYRVEDLLHTFNTISVECGN